MKPLILGLVLTYSALLPAGALAHGSGKALEKQVGRYHIDVHYPHDFRAGVPVFLNFFLSHEDERPTVFTSVDFTLLNDLEVLFQTKIAKDVGTATGATITFPEGGKYKLALAFSLGNSKIAETTFDIKVEESSKVGSSGRTQDLIVGLVVGLAIALLMRKLNP